jgi:hypothetical protein
MRTDQTQTAKQLITGPETDDERLSELAVRVRSFESEFRVLVGHAS